MAAFPDIASTAVLFTFYKINILTPQSRITVVDNDMRG
jgi:hypothetical protein